MNAELVHPRESVVIDHFWAKKIVVHRRHDPGTACRPNVSRHPWTAIGCGHAMPLHVALKIASPCARCWPRGIEVAS